MIAALWAHLAKDLRIEWRAKDAMQSMLFYALLVVVLFSLAFDPTRETSRQYAGGVMCVAVLFAAVQALNQAWSRELRGNVLDAQRMSPAPASALYLAKVLANFIFVLIVEAVLTPVFVVFYNLHPLGNGWLFFVILPLGSWALVANGVFFAALSLRCALARAAVAAGALPDLHSGAAGDGAGGNRCADRREPTRRSG